MFENPRNGRYKFAFPPVGYRLAIGKVGQRQVVLLYPVVLVPAAGTDILHAKNDGWSQLSLDA